ncbi:hypothetical protein [Spirosoma sp.]|uniref:hypothetical protein n=1 Tax=Spirosoma sp. TaxID=1899569 RepID=UPI003B3A22AC
MKSIVRQFMNALILSLLVGGATVHAQSFDSRLSAVDREKSFDVATYMGANRTLNLMIAVRLVKGVTLKLKNAEGTVLHELYLKNSPRAYHHKLNFDGSQAGVYQLEITDGRQIVVRRIEVTDIPAIESQRYITYSSPTNP